MFYSTMIKSTGSVCEQQLKKRKKSCFFTLKNVKKRKCVVSKSSYHPVPKVSTGKSPIPNQWQRESFGRPGIDHSGAYPLLFYVPLLPLPLPSS